MLKPKPLPPDCSPLTFDNLGYEENCTFEAYSGTSDVLTPQQANERPPPPAYDALINDRVEPTPKPIPKNRDHRNLWDKYHEMYENSIFQQLIWFGALVFSIVYIYLGSVYTGKCRLYVYYTDIDTGEFEDNDLAFWMKTEGGVFCGLVLFVFLSRGLELIDRTRTKRKTRSEVARTSKWKIFLYLMRICIFIACFVMSILGGGWIFDTSHVKNKVLDCDKSFYDFYNSAKKGQIVVFASYAAYAMFAMFFNILFTAKNYRNRKFRFFGYLLDVDQDGVITQHDMRKTYEKLELIRRTIGDRGDPVQEEEQLEVFNKYIFKRGPNKDITVDEYVSYLGGIFEPGGSMENKMRPLITALFNAFSTAEYRKKETIIAYEDFARFFDIIAGVDPRHCKKIFIRDFLNPTTMASLLEDFVDFLSKDDFPDMDSVFFMLKPSYEPDPTFERICRPSCCNV